MNSWQKSVWNLLLVMFIVYNLSSVNSALSLPDILQFKHTKSIYIYIV